MQSRKNVLVSLLILAAVTLYSLQFYNVGILCDENYNINILKRILDGEIPYRDFYLHHPPGAYYIQAIIFKFFGEELLVGRLTVVFVGLCVFTLLFFISRKFVPDRYALVASISFLFWGTAHYNIFANNIFIIAFGLLQLLAFLKYIEENRRFYLFLSASLAGMTFLMKQNLGGAVFLYTILTLSCFALLDKNGWPLRLKTLAAELVVFLLGFGAGIAPLAIYFAARGNLFDIATTFFGQQRQYATDTGVSVGHFSYWFVPSYEFKLNWLYGLATILSLTCFYLLLKWAYSLMGRRDERQRLFILSSIGPVIAILLVSIYGINAVLSFLAKLTESVFIYIPYVLVVTSLVWLIKKIRQTRILSISEKQIAAITFFVLCFNYFSFLYSANFIRQINAYPASYLLLGFWMYKFINWECDPVGYKSVRIYFASLLFAVFSFMGFWVAYMQSAPKEFAGPITASSTPLEIPGAKGILVTPETKNYIESVTNYIKTYTAKDEYIFVFPYDCLFYFLTDRKSPSYYDWFILGQAPSESQAEVIGNIERKNVRYVILRDYNSERFPGRKFYPLIDDYLLNNFFLQVPVGNFSIIRKKGDTVPSPYAAHYEKILPTLLGANLLNNGDFEEISETTGGLTITGWERGGLTVNVDKDTPKYGSRALTLHPTIINQYLNQRVQLNNPSKRGEVTFGIWAKGPEAPAFIRLRISTSSGHFHKTYNLSSTWMFYPVNGLLTEKDTDVEVFIFPDNGLNGESISTIEIDGALLVYGDIPSIIDTANQPRP